MAHTDTKERFSLIKLLFGGLRKIGKSFLNFCFLHNLKWPVVLACLLVIVLIVIWAGLSSASVVKSRTVQLGFKNIEELATQSGYYTNVQVIKDSKELWGMKLPFTQSKYIFSYDGVIKAGIRNFSATDIDVNDVTQTISVKIPKAEVLSNEIDENSLEIYDESKSIFTPLELDDINQALIALKEESQETAISNGLLENAEANAKILIRSLLEGSYEGYEIIFE